MNVAFGTESPAGRITDPPFFFTLAPHHPPRGLTLITCLNGSQSPSTSTRVGTWLWATQSKPLIVVRETKSGQDLDCFFKSFFYVRLVFNGVSARSACLHWGFAVEAAEARQAALIADRRQKA